MDLNFAIGSIASVAIIAGIVVIVVGLSMKKKKPFLLGIVLGVIGVVLAILSSSFKIIPTGYSGVRSTFGQIDSRTVPNGFNWKIPFVQDIELVNNKQQDITFDSEIWSETSERTALYYTGVTITYQINPAKSAWIFANVSNYKESLVNQNIIASAIKSSSKELADTDATNRAIIEPLAMEKIQTSLNEKYGEDVVIINKVIISNADFEESYNSAIAAKQKAQLEAQQQAIINKQNIDKAAADATVTVTKTQAEADAKKIQAQAEAEAEVIRAEAEAKANALLEQSLSERILKEMYIERWNGELPAVVGDDSNLLFDLNLNEDSNGSGANTSEASTPTPTPTPAPVLEQPVE